MDNLTHSMVGAAVGELVLQLRFSKNSETRKTHRAGFWWTSILAGNFPDLDILYGSISGPKIGYLLHHRGHTHTVLLAALMGLATAWLVGLILKRFRRQVDWPGLFALGVLGGWLHIFLDYQNIYGVHPFWPWDNRWFYGDTLFIVEALLWLFLLPALGTAKASRRWRTAFGMAWFSTIILVWVVPLIPFRVSLVITLLAGLYALGSMKLSQERKTSTALGLCLLLILGFRWASHQVRLEIGHAYLQRFPAGTLVDLALTPAPSNPWCWSAVAYLKLGSDLVAERTAYAPWPGFLSVQDCPVTPGGVLLNSESKVLEPNQWILLGKSQAEAQAFQAFAQANCGFSAFLQFARTPWVRKLNNGETLYGDLRFDFRNGGGFSDFLEAQTEPLCPGHLPPWIPPRQETFPRSSSP